MKLTKVERTPNPLAMKLSVDEYLEAGTVGVTYTRNQKGLPRDIMRLFTIPGLHQMYRYADFITVEKTVDSDWKDILPQIKKILNR